MPDTHTKPKVMPAAIKPRLPKSYPLPANLDPIQPPTISLPRVRRMPPPTRRPVFTPVNSDTPPSYFRRFNMPTANALPGPVSPAMILSRLTDEEVDNNLIHHAVRELQLLGYAIPMSISRHDSVGPVEKSFASSQYDMNDKMSELVLALIAVFNEGGHSFTTAQYTVEVVNKLLQFQPLAPLTNDPSEWVQHGGPDEAGTDFWQNKRQGECFTNDPQLRYYYRMQDRNWFGRSWFYRKAIPQNLRKWIHDTHIFWINKKHKTQPHPLHPIPGTSTTSTPIVKRNPKHVRIR